jgi:hypothetical protein
MNQVEQDFTFSFEPIHTRSCLTDAWVRLTEAATVDTTSASSPGEVLPSLMSAIICTMTRTTSKIRFKAKLLRPAEAAKRSSWAFLVLPGDASAKLPTRGMSSVEGTINGYPFRATLEPDGQKSHWLKVSKKIREAAGAEAGDLLSLEIRPVEKEPEPQVPADLRKALAAAPKARALWSDITPVARRDWIHWITSAKQSETRARRVKNACDMLAAGKRRLCCFDRSGFFSKSMCAPEAAD